MAEIAGNPKASEQARIAAIKVLADRGYGQASQDITSGGEKIDTRSAVILMPIAAVALPALPAPKE